MPEHFLMRLRPVSCLRPRLEIYRHWHEGASGTLSGASNVARALTPLAPPKSPAAFCIKAGSLQVHALANSEVYEVPHAHTDAIWSLAVQPGGTRLLSGSADKTLAMWTPSEAEAVFTLRLGVLFLLC